MRARATSSDIGDRLRSTDPVNGKVSRADASLLEFPRRPAANDACERRLGRAVSNGYPESLLLGRRAECRALDRLLDGVQAGQSRVLVLRGEPGVGKWALLDYLVRGASGCRVTRAAGVECEMELAYAGLHQLCAPVLDLRERVPAPQREALEAAFGLSADPAPDRFRLGLAVLGLLSEVAARQPLVCVVDDVQWLDQASADIVGFVARRLLAERVAFVCAARTGVGDDVLAGLPELAIEGLDDGDARALLLDCVHGPIDSAVCDRIIAESHGNPLALIELSRTRNAADLAGGFGVPVSRPLASKIEQTYTTRLLGLPAETRLFVLAAAAEPVGDPVLLRRAAASLGLDIACAAPAADAGLLAVAGRVEFANPLVRSAVYQSAAVHDRRRVHRALAEATDAETDPDRRAWHLAAAATGPDEPIAVELERAAGRAQARGGVAAAAAFLQRAVVLTQNRERRAERALAAAQASLQAGACDAALGLVATAEAGALDELQKARADLVRAHVAFASGLGSDAPALLLRAAKRLEPFDLELARETYLTAWGARGIAAHVAGDDVLEEISHAVRALPASQREPRPVDLLLDGFALLTVEGYAAATPTLQRAATALADVPIDDVLRWGWTATGANTATWDFEGFCAIAARNVQVVRDAGALAQLPLHLSTLGIATMSTGDFEGAGLLIAEAESVAAATGTHSAPTAALRLRALQGRESEASELIAGTIEQVEERGHGTAMTVAPWAAAVLYNGLGRYDEAVSAAVEATIKTLDPWEFIWTLPELIEAGSRTEDLDLARDALRQLAESTQTAGTDLALGIEARSRALLREGETAELLYEEAVERLSRTRLRPELARAYLLYGEWLRRENRRVDAREQLRTAHALLTEIGMEAFAARARIELAATGEKVRKRTVETGDELTAQELQVARMALDGLSNPEIGGRLFISPRTVKYHLRKVFTKLDINSRSELKRVTSTGAIFSPALHD
jgi:DNA-binding CsgD family transcriptional regulator/tetratricopeptide (TPR) repeat protein